MSIQPVQFGKITITSAHHYSHDNSDEFYLRLDGQDRRLTPVPSMGDKFTLRVHKDGSMVAKYDVTSDQSIQPANVPVEKDEILPLFTQMATGASRKDWQRLLESDPEATPLLHATFPAVTFENRNGSRHYNRFPEAFQSACQKVGLADFPAMPFYRRWWRAVVKHLPGM